MASRSTTQSEFITKSEAAVLMGVEEKSVTHIEGIRPDGTNLCLKAVPGLYSRADAIQIKKTRDEKAAAKEQAKAGKAAKAAEEAQAKTEPVSQEQVDRAVVERHPAKGVSETEQALKEAVESGQTS